MATGHNTVALLNTAAGKGTTPRSLKRKTRLDPDELQFPVSKKRTIEPSKTTPHKKSKPAAVSPDSIAARRTRRLLKPKTSRVTRNSPLKKVAFGTEIRAPNAAVQLDESPAHGTRARASKQLVELSQSKNIVLQSSQSPSKAKPSDPIKKARASQSPSQIPAPDDAHQPDDDSDESSEESSEEIIEGSSSGDKEPDRDVSSERVDRDEEESEAEVIAEELVAPEDGEQSAASNNASEEEVPSDDAVYTDQFTKANRKKSTSATASESSSRLGDLGRQTLSNTGNNAHRRPRGASQQTRENVADGEGSAPTSRPTAGSINNAGSRAVREDAQRNEHLRRRAQEVVGEIEDEWESLRNKFLTSMGDSVNVNDCREEWAEVGLVMLWMRERYDSSVESEATLSKAVRRSIRELGEAYRKFDAQAEDASDLDRDRQIAELTTKLKSRVKELRPLPGDNHTNNIRIITDLYCYIFPAAIGLLRTVLRIRHRRASLTGSGACAWSRVIDIVLNMCKIARSWRPRPSSLEIGTFAMIHTRLKDGLDGIKANFRADVDATKREERLKKRDKFHEKQRDWFDAMERKREVMLKSPRRLQFSQNAIVSTQRYIHDIEDFDSEPGMPNPINDGRTSTEKIGEITRDQRQTTEEIPAPPFDDWTEMENTALLNGLQIYRDKTRYAEILNTYNKVLEKRDIDDLIAQARYFRQVMMNGLNHSTDDMTWLSSVW